MLQTRSYEMCRLSGNLIQWRKSLFDTVLVYHNKNKSMLRYKFGSVYDSKRLNLLGISGPEVIKLISSSAQLRLKFILHINDKILMAF